MYFQKMILQIWKGDEGGKNIPFLMTLFGMFWPMAMYMDIVEETNHYTVILDAEERGMLSLEPGVESEEPGFLG
jgi:hypothetical protein